MDKNTGRRPAGTGAPAPTPIVLCAICAGPLRAAETEADDKRPLSESRRLRHADQKKCRAARNERQQMLADDPRNGRGSHVNAMRRAGSQRTGDQETTACARRTMLVSWLGMHIAHANERTSKSKLDGTCEAAGYLLAHGIHATRNQWGYVDVEVVDEPGSSHLLHYGPTSREGSTPSLKVWNWGPDETPVDQAEAEGEAIATQRLKEALETVQAEGATTEGGGVGIEGEVHRWNRLAERLESGAREIDAWVSEETPQSDTGSAPLHRLALALCAHEIELTTIYGPQGSAPGPIELEVRARSSLTSSGKWSANGRRLTLAARGPEALISAVRRGQGWQLETDTRAKLVLALIAERKQNGDRRTSGKSQANGWRRRLATLGRHEAWTKVPKGPPIGGPTHWKTAPSLIAAR